MRYFERAGRVVALRGEAAGLVPADVLTSVALVCSPELSERVGGGRERYLPRKALLHECVVLSIRIAGVAALER
jgi:hypothetical protein